MSCEFIKCKDFVMRTFYLTILLTAVSVCGFALPQDNTEIIDLKGKWTFSIDNKTYDEVILPGTTDTNRKGTLNENRNEPLSCRGIISLKAGHGTARKWLYPKAGTARS